jgi:serine/threonine-protein kinase
MSFADQEDQWPEGVPRRGEVVGDKYVCEQLLGKGGMGAVLLARHNQLGQPVAIKVLLPSTLKNPLAQERFLREARSVIALRSDHVARVIDFGTLPSGCPFLVMEHLEGQDLKALITRDGPLPIDTAVDFVLQACEALCEAHQQGIVHRDLKPANLFLSRRVDGSPLVKVLDFGISKTVASATASSGSGPSITNTGAVFGTPAYMSPEQLRNSKHVDHRTDVWSLGVCLFEIITARLPFGSEEDGIASMCAHILEDSPAALHRLRDDAPAGLEAILLRSMQKNPAERFPSIAAFAEAMAPFASSNSTEVLLRIGRMASNSLPFETTLLSDPPKLSGHPPSSGWGRTGSQSSGKKEVIVGLAVAAVLLAGVGIGWTWWTHSQRPLVGVTVPTLPSKASSSAVVSVANVHGSSPSDVPSVPSARPLTSASATSPLATKPPPSASAKPSATVKRSASAHAAPAESAPPPALPSCPAGQAVSNGHCCAIGFEWKGGACVPGVAKGF